MKGKALQKPTVVYYVRWDGDNIDEVTRFFRENGNNTYCGGVVGNQVEFRSSNGFDRCSPGHYIIKDQTGFRGVHHVIFDTEFDLIDKDEA